MKPLYKGLLLAVLHCVIVLSLAGKYAWDRERLPRVWVNATPVDPNTPIRGRYVALALHVEPGEVRQDWGQVTLSILDGKLTAIPSRTQTGLNLYHRGLVWMLNPRVDFFIPENVPDPSIRKAGEELWVEVSVPESGPPRPVRLGVKKNGVLEPLNLP